MEFQILLWNIWYTSDGSADVWFIVYNYKSVTHWWEMARDTDLDIRCSFELVLREG